MTIGKLAQRADLNPRTLRYYERIGLLTPSGRTAAGYRLYMEKDAIRLAFIRQAQGLGLSLAEIADIIVLREAGTAPCRHVSAVARAKVAAIAARIAELRLLQDELMRLAERAETLQDVCAETSTVCRAIERTRPTPP